MSRFLEIAMVARAMAECDDFGPLHIIVGDGNLDDEDIEFCRSSPHRPLTEHEQVFLTALAQMTSAERHIAFEMTAAFTLDDKTFAAAMKARGL